MRHEPVGKREWLAVIGVGAFLLAAAATAGYVINEQLAESHDREIREVAIQRAQLLTELGAALPELTPDKMRRGFTIQDQASITAALQRLRETQPLLGLAVFNRRGQLVYPPALGLQLELPAGINRALRGSPSVERHARPQDPFVEASVPIHDTDGAIIGALAVELDEDQLREGIGRDQRSVFVTLVAGTVLLWLLLLPVSLRLARLAAPYLSLERRRTLRGVGRALAAGELEVHYQPKVAVASGEPCGAEGLVRWRRDGTLVPAAAFLPHVARSELLRGLTEFVLDRAVRDATVWREAGHAFGVAVNLSPQSLADDSLPRLVEATLGRYGLPADALTIELTERAMLDDPARAESVLNALAQLGVLLSVDDFGTGHGAIARLHRFPIRELKIDRSFVARMTADERPFVEAITTMARALGLEVVAEGVEDAATLELLAKTECGTAQGFYFCRPVPRDEFIEWVARPQQTA